MPASATRTASSTSARAPACSPPRSPDAQRRSLRWSSTTHSPGSSPAGSRALSNVTVLRCDVRAVPLPLTPYRVVANPPFGCTAAILRRLCDDPAGALVRADVVVQWQVARHRARVGDTAPTDLLGATWAPWWRFQRGRRLPAASFRPRPSVEAAVLVITRRNPPLLAPEHFDGYATWVRHQFGRRPTPPRSR